MWRPEWIVSWKMTVTFCGAINRFDNSTFFLSLSSIVFLDLTQPDNLSQKTLSLSVFPAVLYYLPLLHNIFASFLSDARDKLAREAKMCKKEYKEKKGEKCMNNGPIFHLPHSPGLFDACQGLVTRLDEENNKMTSGRGGKGSRTEECK